MEFSTLSLQEKIDTRENLVKSMRELNDACKNDAGDVRAMTAEESEKFKKMGDDVRTLTALIENEKRQKTLDGFMNKLPSATAESKTPENRALVQFREYLENGTIGAELRDLSVDNQTEGGVFAPPEFVAELIKEIPAENPLLQRVRIIQLNKAASIKVPVEDGDASDAEWTKEVPAADITGDDSWKFKDRELSSYQLVKLIKVSKKLAAVGVMPIEALVREKLAEVTNRVLEKAILTGDGTEKPLGVFVKSANGISDKRDIATSGATLDADSIIKAKQALRPAYRKAAVWVFHTDMLTSLLTLKDKNDQYLWRSGLTVGEPDRLCGLEFVESEYAPSTVAKDAYVGILGNFSNYWLTMVNNLTIQRLQELFALRAQDGYLSTMFVDGAPMQEAAFARIKIGA